MTTYRVPFENGESEFTEKRSRFISHIWRVETEAEARERIEEMKKRYYDARHNCWCYLLQEGGVVRYSDDGEPQGTAGQPMLNVFQRESVTNVCCVVTRYFGGVLLGAGGLTRAYTKGAKDALDAVGISTMSLWTLWDVPCTYPLFERVKLEITACGGVVRDTEYGADIRLRAAFPAGGAELFVPRLTELSAGSLAMEAAGEEFLPGPRESANGTYTNREPACWPVPGCVMRDADGGDARQGVQLPLQQLHVMPVRVPVQGDGNACHSLHLPAVGKKSGVLTGPPGLPPECRFPRCPGPDRCPAPDRRWGWASPAFSAGGALPCGCHHAFRSPLP